MELDLTKIFRHIESSPIYKAELANYELIESPIEQILLDNIAKFIKDGVDIILQKEIETINGKFRIDLCLSYEGDIIGIECDGEDYHSTDKQKYYDEWRDALVLTSSDITSIFRLRGQDIHADINGMIFFIASKVPNFFDEEKLIRFRHRVQPQFYDNSIKDRGLDGYKINANYLSDDNKDVKRSFMPDWKNFHRSWDRHWTKLVVISRLNVGASVKELLILKNDYMAKSIDELFDQLEKQ